MKKICPNCTVEQEVKLIKDNDLVFVNGKPIKFPSENYVCTECRTDFQTPAQKAKDKVNRNKAVENENKN